ncbi:carboxylesterase 1 [Quercus suber]|uniref:Carboxylesterase 1 n=1 Tax=Quercus suber TaxID=58331 RepID=A0AAW0JAQ9_QUESU|nr:carboxylesterase 1 [Quercus suber]
MTVLIITILLVPPPPPIITKDVTLNPNHNIWLRIFLPSQALASTSNKITKFPLIVYYHGEGFITSSAASTMKNDFCSNMALQLAVVVVSVKYRLAPEHRLPARRTMMQRKRCIG